MPSIKETLLKQEELWLSEENDSDEWYEKGLQLYEKLRRVDHFNFARYNKQQATLLLEQARHEKLLRGNMSRAESLLKSVIDLEPDHPEIYYRLAFINAHHRKWEAVLFYANEALEYGISVDEEIKLSALMGCAYRKINLHRRSKEQFEHAETLDNKKEWVLFIKKYKDMGDERPFPTRQHRDEREASLEIALQNTRVNACCILTLYSSHNCLTTSGNEVSLSLKEAELLAFLALNEGSFVSNSKILHHVWPELALENPYSTVVKRNISSLRAKLAQAFDDHLGKQLIQFVENGYKLVLPVPLEVFKGIDSRRLSCR